MRWLRRLLVGSGLLVVLAALILAVGSLATLDWDRTHAAQTAKLPLASPSSPDGLVRVRTGALVFRARVAGLANRGPALVLLHGFPETSAMWTPLIEAASAAGYRVVAFDQRGYSPGARPEGVSSYVIPELVGDVLAVADAFGFDRFHLVGHDWGAVVGWVTVMQHPERVRSWTALSIPHAGVFIEAMKEDLPFYIDVFAVPWLAEGIFSFNRLALMRRTIFDALPSGDEYLAVFSEPGALTAAINWYRGLRPSIPAAVGLPLEIEPPVLFLSGTRDYWGSRPERARQAELMKGPYEEIDLDAGHYLMEEETEVVVDAILAHLRRVDAS